MDGSTPEKPTKVRLAEAMSAVPGMYPELISRAIDGYYDDYEGEFPFPQVELIKDLSDMMKQPTTGPKARAALLELSTRVMNGDFDGTSAEADAWAKTDEGQQTMREITGQNYTSVHDFLGKDSHW